MNDINTEILTLQYFLKLHDLTINVYFLIRTILKFYQLFSVVFVSLFFKWITIKIRNVTIKKNKENILMFLISKRLFLIQ